jgi:tetratricopeptide (TPR) repeat protein
MREKITRCLLMVGIVFFMAGCAVPKPTIIPQSGADTPQSAYSQGMKLMDDKQYDQAIILFQHAVGLDPVFEPAYINLSMAYIEKNDYKNAMKNIDAALGVKKDAAAYVAYGRFYVAQDKFDKAQSKFNKAIKVDPKCAEAFYYKGQMYEKQAKYEQARIVYNNALVVDPKYEKAKTALLNLEKIEGSRTEKAK